MSASRSFHQSARLPCGSMSIRQTGPAPESWACTARWPDRVVLPDPPFCDANAKTRMLIPSPQSREFSERSGTRGSKIWLTQPRPYLRIPVAPLSIIPGGLRHGSQLLGDGGFDPGAFGAGLSAKRQGGDRGVATLRLCGGGGHLAPARGE